MDAGGGREGCWGHQPALATQAAFLQGVVGHDGKHADDVPVGSTRKDLDLQQVQGRVGVQSERLPAVVHVAWGAKADVWTTQVHMLHACTYTYTYTHTHTHTHTHRACMLSTSKLRRTACMGAVQERHKLCSTPPAWVCIARAMCHVPCVMTCAMTCAMHLQKTCWHGHVNDSASPNW